MPSLFLVNTRLYSRLTLSTYWSYLCSLRITPVSTISPQSGAMNLLCLRRGFWRNMIWENIPGAGGRSASAYPWALIHNRECQSKSRQNWPLTEELLKNQSSKKIDTPRYPLTVLRPCGQEDTSVRLSEHCFHIGLGTEFRSEKIPRNRLGMVSVIPRKKVLIPRHSEAFRVLRQSQFRSSEWNGMELYVKQSHSCCAW